MSSYPDHSELKTIYVKDLPQVIDKDTIQQLFNSYGKIQNVLLKTRLQSSTALITFATHEEAKHALQEANYTKINDRAINIMWERTGKISYPEDGNIVISHLPIEVEENQLHALLEKYGEIYSVSILRGRDGVSRGLGYVQFVTAESATQAIDELQGATLEGQVLSVEHFLPPEKRGAIPQSLPPNVVAVEGPADLLEKSNLERIFGKFGTISDYQRIEDIAVLIFEKVESATRAASSEFHHDKLQVKTQLKKELTTKIFELDEGRRMFVSELTSENSETLHEHLSTAGKVLTLEVHKQKAIFAFVQYETREVRDRAIELLDRTFFPGQTLPMRAMAQYDKRLQHERAGLLIINEIPCSTRFDAFRKEAAEFGTILAYTLVPTRSQSMMGFVLYEKESAALEAKSQIGKVNSWVFPKSDPFELLKLFNEGASSCAVVGYGYPSSVTEHTLDTTFAGYGISFRGVSVGPDKEDGRKVVFAVYSEKQDAIAARNQVLSEGHECDVFSTSILARFGMALNNVPIPPDSLPRFVFATGIPETMSNGQLREIFERSGPTEWVSIIYDASDCRSRGQAHVIFRDESSATTAISDPHFAFEIPQITITPFKNRETHPRRAPAAPAIGYNAQIPLARPRDEIRTMIKSHPFDNEAQREELLDRVSRLSINSVNHITRGGTSTITEWIESPNE